jgi:calcipressin-2
MPGKLAEPPAAQPTNTLVVTQLPGAFFEHAEVLDALRAHFGAFGPLRAWAPLRAFGRAILVYEHAADAERVKRHCDGLSLALDPDACASLVPPVAVCVCLRDVRRAPIVLRVFRADPTPAAPPQEGPEGPYLCPPATTKNFLISPPGSPPVGWEPATEDPPNATPLAADLISALQKLAVLDARGAGGAELLLEAGDAGGVSVFVEDCDPGVEGRGEMGEEDWVYGETSAVQARWKPTATARPPMDGDEVMA